jgi:hypothetical protein
MGYTLLCLNYKSFMANLTFLRVVVNYTAQKADFLFLKYRERAHANKMTAAASAVEPFLFSRSRFLHFSSPEALILPAEKVLLDCYAPLFSLGGCG